MSESWNGREFDRSAVDMAVVITSEDGTVVTSRTGDVGMGGFSVQVDEPLQVGVQCQVHMVFGEDTEGRVEMRAQAAVVWSSAPYIGFSFTHMEPEDYEKMRALFLYTPISTEWR
ncbi:MAG: PilZ domain-containing protein [Leptospirillia bacterium]